MNRRALAAALLAALAAACSRPADLQRRLVLSADEVVFYVKSDDVPTYRVWVMATGQEDWHGEDPTVTVETGGEWLSAEVDPLRDEPHAIVLTPRIAAFTAAGSYSAVVAIAGPGTEVKRVSASLYVLAPELLPSTARVHFEMVQGAGAPPARTVRVDTAPGASGFHHGRPTVTLVDRTCGEWLDAELVTSGAGYAATFTPVGVALAPLASGTTCHALAQLSGGYDTDPPGSTQIGGTALVDVTLTVGTAAAPRVEVSTAGVSFETIPGMPPPAAQRFTVEDGAGLPVGSPVVSVSDATFTVSASGGAPGTVTVGLGPQVPAMPPGQRFATVTVTDPATGASASVPVGLQVWSWDSDTIGLPVVGSTVTSLGGREVLYAGGRGSDRGTFTVEPATPLRAWPADYHVVTRGSMRTPRTRHTATTFAPGHVIAAGGLDPVTGQPVGTWEIFDAPHAHTWYVERPLAIARFAHTATALRDGRVLVAGGAVGDAAYPTAIADVELLDPGEPDPTTAGRPTPAWSAHAVAAEPMSAPRRGASAVLLPRGKVLVAGGQGSDGGALASAEIFDPATGRWSRAAPMNAARADFALVVLSDGRVLAAGGTDADRALATAELYDPAADAWTPARPMHVARAAPGVRLPSGRVLLVGGLTGRVDAADATDTVERFDPATGDWSFAASLGGPLAGHAVTVLDDGLVVVAGGAEVANGITGRIWLNGLYGYGEVP